MIELSKLQCKILKLINSKTSYNLETLSKKLNIDWYECMQNIHVLRFNDLIRIDRDNFLHTLPLGKAYFELKYRSYIKDFIFSVIIPIFVSLITNLIIG